GERRHREREARPERPHADAKPIKPRPIAEPAEDSSAAVGFKDHVPAFLLRPTRLPQSSDALEEV
ncbi:MAG: hypothetical protein ACRED5_10160, partial [Propylenella sp.]